MILLGVGREDTAAVAVALAEKLGLDPLEFRRLNGAHHGGIAITLPHAHVHHLALELNFMARERAPLRLDIRDPGVRGSGRYGCGENRYPGVA
jgi:CO/xanthine dehydrogenase Mo-binding subunit